MRDSTAQHSIETIAIIGQGKVGSSLKQLALLAGFKTTLLGRDYAQSIDQVYAADLIIIATSDDEIKNVVKSLAAFQEGQESQSHKQHPVFIHCSGLISSDVLHPLGENIASCHPLNTFPTLDSALSTFNNTQHKTYMFAEGSDAAIKRLGPVFTKLGFKFQLIDATAKTHYHLACVVACNYLSVLMHSSLGFAEKAGIERDAFWQALQPIIQSTLANISNNGTLNALSGPIARGDYGTIETHLASLSSALSHTKEKELYVSLAKNAVAMTIEKGSISTDDAKALNQLLDGSLR